MSMRFEAQQVQDILAVFESSDLDTMPVWEFMDMLQVRK